MNATNPTGILRGIFLVGMCAAAGFAALPTDVKLTAALGTNTSRFGYSVGMGEIPGKKGNFYVLEQGHLGDSARVRLVTKGANGEFTKKTFLGLKVRTNSEEMGLLGLAFHPNYASNRKYYVYYTMPKPTAPGDSNVLEERTADATLLADAGTGIRRILTVAKTSVYHNGGTLGFGKDGYLYVGLGEDGVPENAQSRKTLLGAILRLDVDNPADGLPYGIPSDNPFVSSADATIRKEIWAYGLRNPWKWSVDSKTGDIWVGDVGQDQFEEINLVKKGGNYGWGEYEGSLCLKSGGCSATGKEAPVVALNRTTAQCIVGGFVYRGNEQSPFYGAYIFSDYRMRKIWGLVQVQGQAPELTVIASTTDQITSFGTDSDGNIYAVAHVGSVYLLDHSALTPGPTSARLSPMPARRKLDYACKASPGLCFGRDGEGYLPDGRFFNGPKDQPKAPLR